MTNKTLVTTDEAGDKLPEALTFAIAQLKEDLNRIYSNNEDVQIAKVENRNKDYRVMFEEEDGVVASWYSVEESLAESSVEADNILSHHNGNVGVYLVADD